LLAGVEVGCEEEFSTDALPEEQRGCFQCGADERGGDAAVESQKAVRTDGLAETVKGAGVP